MKNSSGAKLNGVETAPVQQSRQYRVSIFSDSLAENDTGNTAGQRQSESDYTQQKNVRNRISN